MSAALRIVIVEDDCLIAMDLAELLAEEGHDVCSIAATEVEAVAAAARCAPDMMIVDAHLCEGSGISAMRQVLSQGPMPHVFVSGDRDGILALMPGAVVIEKPFTMQVLLRALAEARQAESHGASG